MTGRLARQFLAFGFVGVIGFAVDGFGGSSRTRAITFTVVALALLGMTAWLTSTRTEELRALVSGIV